MAATQTPVQPVVAAVLRDSRGRILLARRSHGRDLAGLWEFPGGKPEPGEAPLPALARELDEELGIQLQQARPLIRVPQDYPHKRIVLDVYEVDAYRGQPRGREGQALSWCALENLASYPMPAADRPVVAALQRPPWYAITPADPWPEQTLLDALPGWIEAGIRLLQWRRPNTDMPAFRQSATAAAVALAGSGCQLLLNANVELAAELGCGVHLPATQLAALRQRPLPAGQLVAASCHDASDLARAQALELDFVVLGPLLPTASHPQRAALGWPRFAELRAGCSLPIYALGGLARPDLAAARAHGAQGIAAIRGLWPPSR